MSMTLKLASGFGFPGGKRNFFLVLVLAILAVGGVVGSWIRFLRLKPNELIQLI